MNNDLVIIPCPDLKSYPQQPRDQSKCELVQCLYCNENMWLSEKKKAIIKFSNSVGKQIILACYPCMLNELEKMKNNGDIDETMCKQIRI